MVSGKKSIQMNNLHVLINVTPKLTTFLQVQTVTNPLEEIQPFQFLKGLNEVYGPRHSQLLMFNLLTYIEVAFVVLQQEESQRNVLNTMLPSENSYSATYKRGPHQHNDKHVLCTKYGGQNHPSDKCSLVVGFPKWDHPYIPPA